MNTIYLVAEGEYSDYCIRAAFSTMEKAQDYIDRYCPDGDIETRGLDETDNLDPSGHYLSANIIITIGEGAMRVGHVIPSGTEGQGVWRRRIETSMDRYGSFSGTPCLDIRLTGHDLNHVKKLAVEARQEFLRLVEFEHLSPSQAAATMNKRFESRNNQ